MKTQHSPAHTRLLTALFSVFGGAIAFSLGGMMLLRTLQVFYEDIAELRGKKSQAQ